MIHTVPLSLRIYGRLVALYPQDLRRDFGADMVLIFAEDLEGARRHAGLRGVLRVWRLALIEFIRFALPIHAASPAVRVPAIVFMLCSILMTGEMTPALRHAPSTTTLLQAIGAVLLLPLFSTPFTSLAVWACRGRAVVSLELSIAGRN